MIPVYHSDATRSSTKTRPADPNWRSDVFDAAALLDSSGAPDIVERIVRCLEWLEDSDQPLLGEMVNYTRTELNETIDQPVRLCIMVALVTLRPTDEVDFSWVCFISVMRNAREQAASSTH